MRFSVLHLSDLHRNLADEVENPWLLDSLTKDYEQYSSQEHPIGRPTVCIVTGDLVYGVSGDRGDSQQELERQYAQAEEFLVGIADRFFRGDRTRIVILPGNHDVSYVQVINSCQAIGIPPDARRKAELVDELFRKGSRLRWSWRDLAFLRIIDEDAYRNRLLPFSEFYGSFYRNERRFSLAPSEQYDIFDFPDIGFCVLALNSCYDNDPLRRAGTFHPTAVTEALRAIRQSTRTGWLVAAAWHHNLVGGPSQDDYLDVEILQILIDAGVSLAFHGHQHVAECFDERYRLGKSPRRITIVSAGTLCAEGRNLRPGVPRSYNLVELDTESWTGRVHQRKMVNVLANMPVWGPGHFNATNESFIDFELCRPLVPRPSQLDLQLVLEKAERLLGARRFLEAAEILEKLKDVPIARPLLQNCLEELGDPRRAIEALWPPRTAAEVVMVGGALLEAGTHQEAEAFGLLELVASGSDASVREMARRVRERRFS